MDQRLPRPAVFGKRDLGGMKTERRHELKQNVLADALAAKIEAAKPYGRVIAGVVLAVVVIAGVMVYSNIQSRKAKDAAWTDYFIKGIPIETHVAGQDQPDVAQVEVDLKTLDRLANDHPSDPLGHWALLTAADQRLSTGIGNLIKPTRSQGEEELKTAVGNYTNVLARTNDPLFQQRALSGLARAHESLGDLAEAGKACDDLLERWPEGPLAAEAKAQKKRLTQKSTADFYSKLPTLVLNAGPTGGFDLSSGGSGVIEDPLDDLRQTSPTLELERFDRIDSPGALDDLETDASGAGTTKLPSATDDVPPPPAVEPEPAPGDLKPGDPKPGDPKPGDVEKIDPSAASDDAAR